MAKKVIFLILLSVSLSLFVGCGTTAKFVYPSKYDNLIQLYKEPKYSLKVAVLPFEEKRGDENSFAGFWLYLIPIVPYGQISYDRPDAARVFNTINEFNFNVVEDIAKAVVTSLKRSNLFQDVYFTFGGDKSEADLIITGDVISTKYVGKTYSYGLSVYGPVLWFFGLPAGSSEDALSLKIYLNKQGGKTTLWEYAFDKDDSIVQGLYYKWGHDVKAYTSLMEEGMNEAIKSLDEKLSNIPLEKLKE